MEFFSGLLDTGNRADDKLKELEKSLATIKARLEHVEQAMNSQKGGFHDLIYEIYQRVSKSRKKAS